MDRVCLFMSILFHLRIQPYSNIIHMHNTCSVNFVNRIFLTTGKGYRIRDITGSSLCHLPNSFSGPSTCLAHQMASIHDPHLRARASNLPALVCARWANSTTEKYSRAWVKWESWCSTHTESPARPASTFYIALYINDLVLGGCKYGALDAASSGIRWGHITTGLPNPMDDLFLSTVLEGAKRTVGKPKGNGQKEPMSADMAKQIVSYFGHKPNLLHHRLVVVCLLGFSGFLRISELVAIQLEHLRFTSTYLDITIPKAKNDQQREGHVVTIARTGTPFCPVDWVERYLQATGLDSDSNNYLISRLSKTRKGHNAHGSRPLSDKTVREAFMKEIAPICQKIEPGSYCLHSLRSGGASTAINSGVSERLIGKHGRWKSGISRDRYLKDSKKQRLSVSKSLGL